MWRKTACAVAGLIAACAMAFVITVFGPSVARSASFEARWLAVGYFPRLDPQKQDRLATTRTPSRGVVFSFNVPGANTTIVSKHAVVPDALVPEVRNDPRPRQPASPVREIPQDSKQKDRLPVGCEPLFSPVAVPTMANISGRCVS